MGTERLEETEGLWGREWLRGWGRGATMNGNNRRKSDTQMHTRQWDRKGKSQLQVGSWWLTLVGHATFPAERKAKN